MNKKHFFLKYNIAEARPYETRDRGHTPNLPTRNPQEHASYIKAKYELAIKKAFSLLDEWEKQGLPTANGVYIDLEVNKEGKPQTFGKTTGATIMRVSDKPDDNENVEVTIYVEKEKRHWLSDRADAYANQVTEKGRPKYATTLAPINTVNTTDIRSLYTSEASFDSIPAQGSRLYELWIFRSKRYDAETVQTTLHSLGITPNPKPINFESIDVWLIHATKLQLSQLPLAIGYIEGVRPYQQPSVMVASNATAREWNDLLQDNIDWQIDEHCPIVGILDTGVNNAHPLLIHALPEDRMNVAINVTNALDNHGHGTSMAGLALLGDLTDLAYQSTPLEKISHGLSSIKILDPNHQTPNSFYGAVIEEAVNMASHTGAQIQCMAITDDDAYNGDATSSSAALDESIYNHGACNRLVLVSAGNIETPNIDPSNYLESCKANAIKSPGQSWNALTVGAFTDKTVCTDDKFHAIAPPRRHIAIFLQLMAMAK